MIPKKKKKKGKKNRATREKSTKNRQNIEAYGAKKKKNGMNWKKPKTKLEKPYSHIHTWMYVYISNSMN